jgi:glycosyltransferase involved in cell wall biosynthesis
MSQPLVSVIVPIYNVENYLNECANSIINQTYKNLEIILVNDKSSDKSGEIARNCVEKDSRIKLINKPKNEGLNYARKTGFENSCGEYVMFVDSDDMIARDAVEIMLQAAEKYFADMVLGGYLAFNNSRSDLKNTNPYWRELQTVSDEYPKATISKTREEIYKWYINRHRIPDNKYVPLSSISACMKLLSRRAVENINWKISNYRRSEDIPMMRQIYQNTKCLAVLNKVVYYYRHNLNSISTGGQSSFIGPDGRTVGLFEFFGKQFAIDREFIESNKLNLEKDLLWQEIFNYYWYLRDEINKGNFEKNHSEETFLNHKLPRLISDVEKAGGFYDYAKKMGIDEPYREFLRIAKNYDVRAYVEYYKQYQKMQKTIVAKKIKIAQLNAKLIAQEIEITSKNSELERLMGIKASAKHLMGNVKRRIAR